MKIAVILTCFNRKQKTLSCLKSLFEARDNYQPKIDLNIYLTDDGCTDGTADAVRELFPAENITILQGDGNLFWAGGMRFAWKEALKRHNEWDYYLLINDDTDILENCFDELLKTEEYSKVNLGTEALVSGITTSKSEPYTLTYGGVVWKNKFFATKKRLGKANIPQKCDQTNANILLVPKSTVDRIGIFYEGYLHGAADYDYSAMANKVGIPTLLTAEYCGRCDRDHKSNKESLNKLCQMSVKERKNYYNHPVHSYKDLILASRRMTPLRTPIVVLGLKLRIYCPTLLKIGNWRFS